jgi:hypothetical protein
MNALVGRKATHASAVHDAISATFDPLITWHAMQSTLVSFPAITPDSTRSRMSPLRFIIMHIYTK